MKKNRRVILIVIFILIISMIIIFFHFINPKYLDGDQIETIDVSYAPFESLALFWIAEDQDFFAQNNLNIKSHIYDTGAGALNGLLNGEVNIAVGTTEFPLVERTLKQENVQTVATISKSEFIYIVGRKDHGIETISDLTGKKIGTTFGTIAQFFLGRFLNLNGINLNDVTLVNLEQPPEWINAVVNADVDAVSTAQPYANSAKNSLDENAVFWSLQSSQPLYSQVISTNSWIDSNPELVERFLNCLLLAENFAINHVNEAKEIVQSQMNLTDEYIETVWKQNQFELSLDQSMILAMEGEARWLITNNLTEADALPNFLDYVYVDGLKAVKPESVNIIGLR